MARADLEQAVLEGGNIRVYCNMLNLETFMDNETYTTTLTFSPWNIEEVVGGRGHFWNDRGIIVKTQKSLRNSINVDAARFNHVPDIAALVSD